LRFASVQAVPLSLEVEGLQSSGSPATETTLRSTDECCVIEEGELVHCRSKIVRQCGWIRYRTGDDLEQFLLDRAMGRGPPPV